MQAATVVQGRRANSRVDNADGAFGMQVGQLMGGAILTETVFAWPGLGRLMVGAILDRDYPLLQGTILVFAGAYILINLLVDLSYGLIDPQVSAK
jgi:peptide/nickel transport system permease protein